MSSVNPNEERNGSVEWKFRPYELRQAAELDVCRVLSCINYNSMRTSILSLYPPSTMHTAYSSTELHWYANWQTTTEHCSIIESHKLSNVWLIKFKLRWDFPLSLSVAIFFSHSTSLLCFIIRELSQQLFIHDEKFISSISHGLTEDGWNIFAAFLLILARWKCEKHTESA